MVAIGIPMRIVTIVSMLSMMPPSFYAIFTPGSAAIIIQGHKTTVHTPTTIGSIVQRHGIIGLGQIGHLQIRIEFGTTRRNRYCRIPVGGRRCCGANPTPPTGRGHGRPCAAGTAGAPIAAAVLHRMTLTGSIRRRGSGGTRASAEAAADADCMHSPLSWRPTRSAATHNANVCSYSTIWSMMTLLQLLLRSPKDSCRRAESISIAARTCFPSTRRERRQRRSAGQQITTASSARCIQFGPAPLTGGRCRRAGRNRWIGRSAACHRCCLQSQHLLCFESLAATSLLNDRRRTKIYTRMHVCRNECQAIEWWLGTAAWRCLHVLPSVRIPFF